MDQIKDEDSLIWEAPYAEVHNLFQRVAGTGNEIESNVLSSDKTKLRYYRWKLLLFPSPRNKILFQVIDITPLSVREKEETWIKCSTILNNEILSSGDNDDGIKKVNASENYTVIFWHRFDDPNALINTFLRMQGLTFQIEFKIFSVRLKERKFGTQSDHERKLASDIMTSLDYPRYSDVTIYVDGAELKAHKVILASRSAVLAQFLGRYSVGQRGITSYITITEFTMDVVQFFLSYLYGGYVIIPNQEMAVNLLKIAFKYDVRGLKKLSADYLTQGLSPHNCLEILHLAYEYKEEQLQEDAINFFLIQQNISLKSSLLLRDIEKRSPELLSILLKRSANKEEYDSIARRTL